LTPTTILIPARNAAATIRRAVASAVAESGCRILLLDHGSTDGTPEVARQTCRRIEILRFDPSLTLGALRQAGLEAVSTEFGVWLDADDELLPGRCRRLAEHLERKPADLAFDEIELYDGTDGHFLRRLAIPPFLRRPSDLVRCFERNYLPGVGVPGFRTEFARSVGYDPSMHGAEDYDFLLRALAAGARTVLVRRALYRQYAYPSSLSRDLERQRRMCARALAKHRPERVELLLRAAGLGEAECAWAMVAFHVFQEQYSAALLALDRFESALPSGAPDLSWRAAFQRGTLLLLLDCNEEAAEWLERAQALQSTAETCNNLGVARARMGRTGDAARLYAMALARFPAYLDALANRSGTDPLRITALPLRREPARSEYTGTRIKRGSA
jgi:hypothetical protein